MRASAHVGRVGGLAVALGIGAAVVAGGAGSAWATPADTSDSRASADSAAQSDAPRPVRTRGGRSAGLTAPAANVARGGGVAPGEQSAPSNARLNPESATRAMPAPRTVAARQRAPINLSGLLAPKPSAQPVAGPPDSTNESIEEQVSAAPEAAAPEMVAASSNAVVDSGPSSLLGSGSGVPVESPLSWVVLAATRRDIGESNTVVVEDFSMSAGQQVASAAATSNAPVISSVVLGTPVTATGAVTGTVQAADPNRDALSYKATTSAKGRVTITTAGVFTYIPTATARHAAAKTGAVTATTTDTVTVTVTDSTGATASRTVTVPISPANAIPVTRTTVGTPNTSTGVVTGSVTATDADRDTLSYSGSTTTAKGRVTVNARTGAFTYTPTATARHAAARTGAATAAKTDTFTVTVSDGYGGNVPVTVTVTISPRNTAPVAGTTTVGTPNATTGVVTGTVTATDADRDALAYSAPATTAKGAVTVNAGTGAFTYTPAPASRNVSGTDTFTVTITDGYGGSTPVAVSVPIAGATQQNTLNFVFNYGDGSEYWTPEAKNSLQSAANLLTRYFVVDAPVTVVFDVSAENSPDSMTLASAGSDLARTSAGFFNTVVQEKILTGVDANGVEADGYIDVNLGIPWAYGDSVSSDEYDFTSTAIHEMLHSLGFLSYIERPGSSWNARGTNWTMFDSFIMTSNKTKVIGTTSNRYRWNTAYNTNLTGGNGGLYFGGPNAVLAYGGLVPLYTPNEWESGSSGTHLDDDTFTGSQAMLMNAYGDVGRGIRVLSTVELAILKDLGYTVVPIPGTASALLFIGLVFLRRRTR